MGICDKHISQKHILVGVFPKESVRAPPANRLCSSLGENNKGFLARKLISYV